MTSDQAGQNHNEEDLPAASAASAAPLPTPRYGGESRFISGSTFAINYQLQEIVGEGAGSVVYKALHKFLGETVAIKVLKKTALTKASDVERFKREARLAMKLEHPHVVKLRGFGINDANEPFIVMEFIEGKTLEMLLKSGPLKEHELTLLACQLADALFLAHTAAGIVHRDLKPANIILAPRGNSSSFEAKLLDFGLAKELSNTAPSAIPGITFTNASLVQGTPNYMSPEQCQCKPVDQRSDIYSLGCVLFEAATGRKPFEAQSDLAVMSMHVNDQPVFRSSDAISDLMRGVILKCMEKDPAKRYQSAKEIMSELIHRASPQALADIPAIPLRAALTFCLSILCLIFVAVLFKRIVDEGSLKSKGDARVSSFRPGKNKIDDFDGIHKNDDAEQLRRWADELKVGSVAAPANFDKAGRIYLRARKLALRDKQHALAARCMIGMAVAKLKLHDEVAAESFFMHALAESRKFGYEKGIYDACQNLSDLAAKRHDLSAAAKYSKTAVEHFPREEMGYFGAVRRYVSILLRQNEYTRANRLLKNCIGDLRQMNYNDKDVRNETEWTHLAQLELALKVNDIAEVQRLTEKISASSKFLPRDFAEVIVSVSAELYEKKQLALARRLAECVLQSPRLNEDIKTRSKAQMLVEKCGSGKKAKSRDK